MEMEIHLEPQSPLLTTSELQSAPTVSLSAALLVPIKLRAMTLPMDQAYALSSASSSETEGEEDPYQ